MRSRINRSNRNLQASRDISTYDNVVNTALSPDYRENAADVLDVGHEHAVVGDYPAHRDFPGHDCVPEDVVKVFSIVDEVVRRIREHERTGFVEG